MEEVNAAGSGGFLSPTGTGGATFGTPVAVYARFLPREIAMEASLRAEGFLRRNERGEYTRDHDG